MNLLLDTHIVLWWLGGDPALPEDANNAIASAENVVSVSAASIWEIAIKCSIAWVFDDIGPNLTRQALHEGGEQTTSSMQARQQHQIGSGHRGVFLMARRGMSVRRPRPNTRTVWVRCVSSSSLRSKSASRTACPCRSTISTATRA